jgi:NADPH-dependent curcumin reductase CurA
MVNHKWVLVSRPEGLPKISDFAWREEPVPEPAEGQVLVRSIYLSLDPAMRGWMARDTYIPAVPLDSVMRGGAIGIVESSRHPDFAVGDRVQGPLGWQEYLVSDGKNFVKLPDVPVPLHAHFGLLGHIGMTAYFGLLDVGQPQEGETLLVSAAAGAVGSLAGQIGKIKGCRVVGLAGSEAKCEWLRTELGFDAAINYRTENLRAGLLAHCPNGIDIYFDNVGGEMLEAALNRMNQFGRIAVCGMIAGYNATGLEPGPRNLQQLIVRRVRMQGFLVMDYMARAGEAARDLLAWHNEGRLRYRVDITQGLEQAPAAFLTLFDGSNRGKVLVQVSTEN